MSARDELDKFITPEIRAKVDAFVADCAGESDDVDMDEVVRQNLADHEAALTGKPTETDAADRPVPLPPGTELRRVLDARGLSQIQLARKAGLSTKHVNQICSGKAALSYETAIKLEGVTGVPASWWNAAEAAYRTALLRGVTETWRGPKVEGTHD